MSIRSSNDQVRALLPMMMKDDLPPGALPSFVKVMSRITSDHDKATLLSKVVSNHDSLTSSGRDVIIASAATVSSDSDRGRVIVAIA